MAKVSRKGFSPRKIVFELNLNVHFLLFCCDAKKKKTEPKEEKTRYSLERVTILLEFFNAFFAKKLEKNSGAKSNSLYAEVRSGGLKPPP